MEAKELPRVWIQDEINHQMKLIKMLQKSGMDKITGFQDVFSMRQEFLRIAKKKLLELKQQ